MDWAKAKVKRTGKLVGVQRKGSRNVVSNHRIGFLHAYFVLITVSIVLLHY